MKELLHNKLQVLENETNQMLSSLEGLTEENLHDKSYGWSIIQVLSHLDIAEERSVMYMKKKIQAGDDMPDSNLLNSLRVFWSNYFMQTSLKWKAPAPVSEPKGDYSFDEVKNKWKETRAAIKEFIDNYPDNYANKAVLKHPLQGRLTLEQSLDSFLFHLRHHVHQLRRIRKKIGA